MDFIPEPILKMIPMLGSILVFRAIITLSTPKKDTTLAASSLVEPAASSGTPGSLEGINPNGNILERIDFWVVKNMNLEVPLDLLHMQMGRPAKPTPLDILHYKEGGVFFLGFFLFMLGGPVAIVLAPIGFFLPDQLLKGNVQDRQQKILGNFPQFVDLTALLIESGSDYMTAFDKICKVTRKKTELEVEIEKTIAEVSLGAPRKDALRHLADRVGLQEIRSFVGLIIQSEELGTSLVGLLRDFAADMRFRRFNKAEKLAAQAATKMLFPLFFFIFPTVFVLMLAPMIGDFVGGGGLFG